MKTKKSIVMLGGSGAVGSETFNALLAIENVAKITLLGRTPITGIESDSVIIEQYKVDIFNPDSYKVMSDHTDAICTLGVGQPSKVSKEDFVKIDKLSVIDFARACKKNGVKHFQLLSSVSADPSSFSFFLKIKGELIEELKKMNFERLSIFQPSMILTPTNRYGLSQAIVLKVWPVLKPILIGGLSKFRGVKVDVLGRAIALNILQNKKGVEILQWNEFYKLANRK